jgi:hypothetical protein
MAVLERPALNFAFIDGVARYHTAHDDVAHLDRGSVQHHGDQALALARAFGNGPLPRPTTGDAVFFDVPLLGLIVYPESWAMPLSLVALVLVLAAAVRLARHRDAGRWGRDMTLGTVGTLAAVVLGGGAATLAGSAIGRLHASMGWGGAASFRGVYSAAIIMLALSVALTCWALVRRWASVAGAHVGALVAWGILTLVVTWRLPGVSFLFAWPLLAAAIAVHVSLGRAGGEPIRSARIALWVATVIAAVVLVPVIYAISTVALGVIGTGGIAAGVLTALLAWLLAPQVEAMGAGYPWRAAAGATVAAAVLFGIGMTTVRRSPEHPAASLFAYALDSATGAWVAARGPNARHLGAANEASSAAPPSWLAGAIGAGPNVAFVSAPRVLIDLPSATVLADSTSDGKRRLSLRLRAAPGTERLAIRADGAPVLAAEVDGRTIDTSRYRARATSWRLDYSAPPDSGVTLALTLPAGGSVSLDLTARLPGLPALPGVTLPRRPPGVVTSQTGDVTIVHQVVRVE